MKKLFIILAFAIASVASAGDSNINIYSQGGEWLGYIRAGDHTIFSNTGEYRGYIRNDNVFDATSTYRGYIRNGYIYPYE
jgi:hypothetical protein